MHRASAVALAFSLAACGGRTNSSSGNAPQSPGDAGAEAGADAGGSPGADAGPAVHTMFLVVLRAGGCLPQTLPDGAGGVPCTVFEVLPGGASCEAALGLGAVDPGVAAEVRTAAQASATDGVCTLAQLVAAPGASCASSADPGWCYVTGAAAGGCPQTIAFTNGAVEPGAVVVLGCD